MKKLAGFLAIVSLVSALCSRDGAADELSAPEAPGQAIEAAKKAADVATPSGAPVGASTQEKFPKKYEWLEALDKAPDCLEKPGTCRWMTRVETAALPLSPETREKVKAHPDGVAAYDATYSQKRFFIAVLQNGPEREYLAVDRAGAVLASRQISTSRAASSPGFQLAGWHDKICCNLTLNCGGGSASCWAYGNDCSCSWLRGQTTGISCSGKWAGDSLGDGGPTVSVVCQ